MVRTIPNFPEPGILFYDITTVLKDPIGMHFAIDALCDFYLQWQVDIVIGIEARGFIFASSLAYRLNAGFVPVRKPKKLPGPVKHMEYRLEYGQQILEVHEDAIKPKDRVLIIDDVLATGGTAGATVEIVESLGGQICGLGFFIELESLHARQKFSKYPVQSVLKF